jgi:cyclohexanone monooxygenase
MIVSIEQHVDWITDALAALRAQGHATIEPAREAEDAWVEEVNAVAHRTLYPQANSWYMGANVPGKPRLFMPYVGGVGTYRQLCDEVARENYRGFIREATRTPA